MFCLLEKSMSKIKIIFPLSALIIALILVWYMYSIKESQSKIPELYDVPEFSFHDRDGESFTIANLKGHVSIVDFIFTNCPGLCPMMASKLLPIHAEFKMQKNFQIVSFSVDPARDSLQALQQYANRYDITDKIWRFIRTDKKQIDPFYENGFKLGGELPFGHSGAFILVDQNAKIRGYYDSGDEMSMKILKKDLQTLLDKLN